MKLKALTAAVLAAALLSACGSSAASSAAPAAAITLMREIKVLRFIGCISFR